MTVATRGTPALASPRLGFWMTVALVMGNMIGSGIFLLPASLAPYGALSLLGWLVSTVGALALAAVFATLSRADPAAGGPYAYTRRAFGDVPGFLVAWGYAISIWTGLAALAVALVGYLTPFLPRLAESRGSAALVALTTVWLLVGVNIAGVRSAGWVQVVTTALKLVPLVAIGLAGVVLFDASHFTLGSHGARSALNEVTAAAALTLWAFLGLEAATVPADSIDDPDRTIPRATLAGTMLVAIVYVLSTAGVMSLVHPDALGRSAAPYADAAGLLGGDWAMRAVAAGAALSCFGALNGWTLVAGHLPLAAARDGLFPRVFARMSSRHTPAAGLVIAGAYASGLVALNYTRDLVDLFTFFIRLATLSTLIPYAFCSLGVFLPDGRRDGARPSRTIAAAAVVAFAFSLWAMGGVGEEAVYWGFLLLIAGLPVYVAISRK